MSSPVGYVVGWSARKPLDMRAVSVTGKVCKTFIRRFDPAPRLQEHGPYQGLEGIPETPQNSPKRRITGEDTGNRWDNRWDNPSSHPTGDAEPASPPPLQARCNPIPAHAAPVSDSSGVAASGRILPELPDHGRRAERAA